MGKFLSNVQVGKKQSPLTVILYGKEGVGKTTFIAGAPKPIMLGEPHGADEIDNLPNLNVTSWPEAIAVLDELCNERHDYQTFALDTADWLEPLIWNHLCLKERKNNIEDFGYGKGYTFALSEWRLLLSKLEVLRDQKGMNLIVTAHAQVKTFHNPSGDNYDRFQMKLNDRAAALLREWSMSVLFAVFETFVKKQNKKDDKGKAFGEGARMLKTQPRPSYDAKTKYALPETLPLSWAEFEAAARSNTPETPDAIIAQIKEVIGSVDDATRAQGDGALGRCGTDPVKLLKLLDWLRGKANAAEQAA